MKRDTAWAGKGTGYNMHWIETDQRHEDVTTWVDTENNVIYGRISSLSLFSVMIPLPSPPLGGKAASINISIHNPELQIPLIWLTTGILSLALVVVYVKRRKRHTEINS